jgi:hypothetical protein
MQTEETHPWQWYNIDLGRCQGGSFSYGQEVNDVQSEKINRGIIRVICFLVDFVTPFCFDFLIQFMQMVFL